MINNLSQEITNIPVWPTTGSEDASEDGTNRHAAHAGNYITTLANIKSKCLRPSRVTASSSKLNRGVPQQDQLTETTNVTSRQPGSSVKTMMQIFTTMVS